MNCINKFDESIYNSQVSSIIRYYDLVTLKKFPDFKKKFLSIDGNQLAKSRSAEEVIEDIQSEINKIYHLAQYSEYRYGQEFSSNPEKEYSDNDPRYWELIHQGLGIPTEPSFSNYYFDDIFKQYEADLIKTLNKSKFKTHHLAITNFT